MQRRQLLGFRVTAVPVLIATVIVLEAFQFFGSFRFFTLVASFLLLADIASLSRGKLQNASLALATVTFGIGAMEGFAILAEPKIATMASEGLAVSKSVVGWGPSHAGRFHDERIDLSADRIIYKVDYTIDAKFLRETKSAIFGPSIVFFGDSLTFGSGLNDADTLPQQFAGILDHKVRIVNLAYIGYGPSQFLRILQEHLFESIIGPNPKLFVFLTAAWQAERTACKPDWTRRAPRFVLENAKPVLNGTCRDAQATWLRDRLRPFAVYRMLVEPLLIKPNDGDVELYIETLNTAVRLAEERYGVRTIILYLRTEGYLPTTTRFTDDIVMTRLREGDAIVLDFSLAHEQTQGAVLRIPGDGHPTALANRLRAAMLKEYVERNVAWSLASEPGGHLR
jgi:hypothetical protein